MQEAGVIVPTSTEVTLSPSKDSSENERRDRNINKISTNGEHRIHSEESEETVINKSFDSGKQTTHEMGKNGSVQTRYKSLYYKTSVNEEHN